MPNRVKQPVSGRAVWYEPEDQTPREQCPCCDYVSLPERGNYLICPVCFWEDNGIDLQELGEHSGPDTTVLLEARRNSSPSCAAIL